MFEIVSKGRLSHELVWRGERNKLVKRYRRRYIVGGGTRIVESDTPFEPPTQDILDKYYDIVDYAVYLAPLEVSPGIRYNGYSMTVDGVNKYQYETSKDGLVYVYDNGSPRIVDVR